MIFKKKPINFILKITLNSDFKVLDSKIKASLSKLRITHNDFIDIFKYKLDKLGLKSTLKLNVNIVCFKGGEYHVFIKLPNINFLINQALSLSSNFKIPGKILKCKTNYYVLTPYIVYEVVKFKYFYEGYSDLSLADYYKKTVSSFKSNGFYLYLC